jgi:hypothetical protein
MISNFNETRKMVDLAVEIQQDNKAKNKEEEEEILSELTKEGNFF